MKSAFLRSAALAAFLAASFSVSAQQSKDRPPTPQPTQPAQPPPPPAVVPCPRLDLRGFVADNREGIGTTVDRLNSITTALNDRQGDIKQVLHIAPTVFQNFMNIYQPAQSAVTGILAPVNFANTVGFICGSIQAASRENFERSSKLCVQYLAPIIKNRQMNFPPLGGNPFAGASARPNEITYSEDRLRPDLPPPVSADPAAGLPGLMVPETGS